MKSIFHINLIRFDWNIGKYNRFIKTFDSIMFDLSYVHVNSACTVVLTLPQGTMLNIEDAKRVKKTHCNQLDFRRRKIRHLLCILGDFQISNLKGLSKGNWQFLKPSFWLKSK